MSESVAHSRAAADRLIAALLFVVTLVIFWLSPVRGTTDIYYSMLVSQSLVSHGSFALDYYDVPRADAGVVEGRDIHGRAYQLETARGHVYYYFPPGGPVLCAPFVALANLFGVSAANPDGTYSPKGEMAIHRALAALLMAALTAVFFFTARLLLRARSAVVVALGGALGTQVWSTASRVVWSDTWAILLLGVAVWMLLAHECGARRLRPVLLASLLAWSYFSRPTSSVPIAAISLYLLLFNRKAFPAYASAGALWAAGLFAYSWHHFGRALPAYYEANRLEFHNFSVALYGNLFSPSRGLLVYVPVVAFVAYLILRYRRRLPCVRLAFAALAICALHLVVVSGFDTWYGGGCYGPRYTTGLVPWFVLLAVLGVRAALDARTDNRRSNVRWRTELAAGATLLALSVAMNARGALSRETDRWNTWPASVDERPERVFDWRYPQFLAGLILPPPPEDAPLVSGETRIDFTSHDADKFLWRGWSGPEPTHRWSEESSALFVFAEETPSDTLLRMSIGGYVGHNGIKRQRVLLKLNGVSVASLTLTEEAAREQTVMLPARLLRAKNVLTFELPDAASPAKLEGSPDTRKLGVRVVWLILLPQATATIGR